MPDDLASEMGKKNLGHINGDDPWGKTVQEVTTRFTECAHDRLDHKFLFAQGWKSASDLLVLEELQFSNEPPQSATITAPGPDGKVVTRSVTVGTYGPGARGIWIAVNKACRVTGNKIALKGQTIEKHEHSSEFVNRAWTYGAYWMKSPAEDFFTSAQAKQAKGDLDGAIADYSRSIELAPTNPYAYYNRGNIKQAKGDLDGAISDYNSAIELDPKYADAYNNRGLANALLRNWAGALTDYRRFCELSESGQDYPRLSIWLIRGQLGETDAASKELSTYLDKRQKATASDWFSKVAEHLLGKVSEADLFAGAASPDPKTDSGQHCEAWFYTGMKKLFSGDKKTAANYFHKCLATEQKDFTEFQLAQSELKALGK
jgi:lipoprotein NlpI